MKRITKKQYKEAPEFIVIIDWSASYKTGFTQYTLDEASTTVEAMNNAEYYMDSEKVYLLKIAQKNRITEENMIEYKDILVNRGHNWHAADEAHFESCFTWTHTLDEILADSLY